MSKRRGTSILVTIPIRTLEHGDRRWQRIADRHAGKPGSRVGITKPRLALRRRKRR